MLSMGELYSRTKRFVSKGAEKELGKEHKVLDQGFIRLVDYMGKDGSLVRAARTSYGKGTKKASEDRTLIRYLVRKKHTTPVEFVETIWHAKMPIFVARQWVRHRTASINEYSGRYSIMPDEFFIPELERIQAQSKLNRQGSGDTLPLETQQKVRDLLVSDANQVFDHYNKIQEDGVARELARIGLPLSTYTQWYWKMDLHNLFHFLKLRIDPHAQEEIRKYAIKMGEITKKSFPVAYEAFEDYILNAVNLSTLEQTAMMDIMQGIDINQVAKYRFKNKFERQEFLDKYKLLQSKKEPIEYDFNFQKTNKIIMRKRNKK